MELKLAKAPCVWSWAVLLIVPYGIETVKSGRKTIIEILLIVPYGIETVSGSNILKRYNPF